MLKCYIALFYALFSFVFSQSNTEKINTLITEYHRFHLFQGAVLVVEDGDVLLKKGFGLANKEWNIPNTPQTKFRIGSITKQFTAMLIMQFVEEGILKLDGTLTQYISDYPKESGDKITIHQLLNHTSGIPSYTGFPNFRSELMRKYASPKDFVKIFWEKELEFEPGTAYRYNNSGYFLLGYILETVSGKSYDTLLKERIFTPLQMTDSGYDWSEDIIEQRASGYRQNGLIYQNAPFLDMSLPYAAGSMYSTVEDLHKWDTELYSPTILSEDGLKKMMTPNLENYGYGFHIDDHVYPDKETEAVVSHGGGINGFSTLYYRVPEKEHLIVLLNNTNRAPLYEMAKKIHNILEGFDVESPEKPLALELEEAQTVANLKAKLTALKAVKDPRLKERELNSLGYSYLTRKEFKKALFLFKTTIDLFPKSANTYDSYAEALLSSGDKDGAIRYYKKALEIDIHFNNARTQLAQLGVTVDAISEVEVSESVLQTYVGKYEIKPGFVLTITCENGQLMAQATGQPKFPLFAESTIKFFLKVIRAQIQFNHAENGTVSSATLFQNGREITGKRL